MKYAYLDYLAEDKLRFMNTIGIFTFLLVFLSIIMVILFNQRTLSSNDYMTGVVLDKGIETIQRKSQATYSSHYVDVTVVTISIGNNHFKLEPQFKEYQKKMLNEIRIGDTLKVYYKRYTNNELMPVQIERNNEIILPFTFFQDIRRGFLYVTIPIFLILSFLTISLLIKRRNVIKNQEDMS
jgi:uncharacterized membrane protein